MNCKAGDLAIIINADNQVSDCIGKIVRVITLHNMFGGNYWELEEIFEIILKNDCRALDGRIFKKGDILHVGYYLDDYLMPLPGESEVEQFDKELELEEL